MLNKKQVECIQDKIGYSFANPALLCQAFTRRSYAKENGGADNEVLELIGDSVLGTLCLKGLLKESGRIGATKEFVCSFSEAELTKRRTDLVEKEALSSLMDRLGLAQFLIMGKGDQKLKVAQQPSVKEDLFEAIIGAITIDCDWDFKRLEKIVLNLIRVECAAQHSEKTNYVEAVQRWFDKKYGELPQYEWYQFDLRDDILEKCAKRIERDTNYGTGAFKFYCRLPIPHLGEYVLGIGASQDKARKKACEAAYHYLHLEEFFSAVRNQLPKMDLAEATKQLKELADKGRVPKPSYRESNRFDKNGRTVWCVECVIDGKTFNGEAFQKKEAKKIASHKALKYLLK